MEPTIRAHVEKMFKNLSLNFGGVIDLRVYFFAWNTDFITGQIFQSPSELFWDPKRAQQWFNTLWDFSANFGLTKHAPWMITAGLTLPTFLFKVLRPSLAPFIAVYKVSILSTAPPPIVLQSLRSYLFILLTHPRPFLELVSESQPGLRRERK